jgi:hypothetical protein
MGVRGRIWLGLFAVLTAAGCAPQSADRTPSGQVIGGEGGSGRATPMVPRSNEGSGGSGGSVSGTGGSGGVPGTPMAGAPGGSGPPEGPSGPPPDAALPDTPPPDTAPPDIGPPLIDALAASCNNLPAWRSGVQYGEGADITHMEPRRRFECRPWPYTPWCALPAYEPGLNRHWPDAWIDRGRCP